MAGLPSPSFWAGPRARETCLPPEASTARQLPGGGAVSLSYSGAFVFCRPQAGGGENGLSRAER